MPTKEIESCKDGIKNQTKTLVPQEPPRKLRPLISKTNIARVLNIFLPQSPQRAQRKNRNAVFLWAALKNIKTTQRKTAQQFFLCALCELCGKKWGYVRQEPPRKLRPLISESKMNNFNAETLGHREAENPVFQIQTGISLRLCVPASPRLKKTSPKRAHLLRSAQLLLRHWRGICLQDILA